MEENKPEKKKGLIGKLKDIGEEKEHQLEVLGTLVRLGVVVWSGFIITMNYVDIPMVCLLYTSPSPRDGLLSRMPSSA